jgi:hypothetical protein
MDRGGGGIRTCGLVRRRSAVLASVPLFQAPGDAAEWYVWDSLDWKAGGCNDVAFNGLWNGSCSFFGRGGLLKFAKISAGSTVSDVRSPFNSVELTI